ncbi:MAG: UvrD-helicase domain-containing protein, partial [Paramuribaculum sp.]
MLAIYKASAGSGKTFTLAYEYIKMLLGVKNPNTGRYLLNRGQRDRHRHILAVTFTKKATGEMKERIIHELAVLGNLEYKWPDQSPYAKRLCDELHCTPDELTKAAATALRQLLFDFNFFQVNTIDSFFQGILRTFAHEVDVSGNYEVDLDSDRAISQSVRDLFDSLSTDSPDGQSRRLQQWITQYLIGQLNSGRQVSLFNRSSTVYSNFIEFIKSISNDVFDEHYGKMMDYLSNPERLQKLYTSLSKQADSQIKETKSLCRAAVDAITSRGYDGSGKLKVSAYLMKKLKEMAGAGECKDIGKTVAAVNEDILNAFTGNLKKLMEQSADTGLCDAINDATRSITEGAARLAMLRDIRSNIFVLGLLKNIYDFIEKYRKDNNTLILSDTNTLLRTIIGDDDAPFVYERTGTWINHFLIDEFQDTSKVQWENLRPLLHEGQSVGNDSLIIGDEKQCIYRFRFSDPTLLQHQVQEDFGVKSMIKGNDSAGNTNWRSSADVVSFNNDFFSAIAGMTGFTDIYANVRQQISPKHKDHRGYIKLTGVGHTEGATFSETALRLLTDDIVRQLRAGYRPCDIAVLTRFNNEAADVIASLMEACKEYE